MKTTTATIPTIVRFAVIDAVQAARSALREATQCGVTDTEAKAALLVAFADDVSNLVRLDEHDPLMHLRIGNIVVALEDMAPTMAQGHRIAAVADRLRVAGLLLQQARRAADLQRRLDDILPLAQEAHAVASGLCDADAPNPRKGDDLAADLSGLALQARNIARLARA